MRGGAAQELCLAVDIGGTNLRCAVVAADGTVLVRAGDTTSIDSGCQPFLDRLAGLLCRLREEAEGRWGRVGGVGLGVPGLFSPDGVLCSSVNLTPLEGVRMADEIAAATGLPAVALNDANACAVGECRFGAGRPFTSSLTVTLGTGVGAGLVLDGRLWTGIDGVAGEFGHVTVERDGRPCNCGNRGCLEQYASASAIAARAAVLGLGGVKGRPNAAQVAALARQGDPTARAVFEEAGSYLGIAAAGVVNLLNLEAIILGGGVSASLDLLEGALQREIAQRCFAIPGRRVRLLKSELGDDAGILGAAAAAFALSS